MKFAIKSLILIIALTAIVVECGFQYTGLTADGSGDVIFLDRQKVSCPAKQAISYFRLNRQGSNLRYKYACISHAGITDEVRTKYTGWNKHDGTGGSTNYLDRHNVKCDRNWVLQSFKLQTSGSNIRYKYKCVHAPCQDTYTDRDTGRTDAGRKYETYYLDRQEVGAVLGNYHSNQALFGFRLQVIYKKWYQSGIAEYYYKRSTCTIKNPPPTPPPKYDGKTFGKEEKGFCVDSKNQDVNTGVTKLKAGDFKSDASQEECLALCQRHPGATGCEAIWEQNNKGCYVHTSKKVHHGNGAANHACWISSALLEEISKKDNNIRMKKPYVPMQGNNPDKEERNQGTRRRRRRF